MDRQRLIRTFETLVRIPSPTFKEAQIIRRIRNKLRYFDVEINIDKAGAAFGSSAGNLIATLPATDSKLRSVAFAAHVDTVDPCADCSPIIESDCIRSNGSTILGADDKAGVSIMIELLESLVESKCSHGLVQFIFTISEEKGLLGSKNLDFELLQCEDIVVLDGDGKAGCIINRAPFQNSLHINVLGKSAHAGVNPDRGINAIHAAAKALAELEFGRLDEETTANVGVMSGGIAGNIVPDKASVDLEVRSHDSGKLEHYSSMIEKSFNDQAGFFGAEVTIEKLRAYEGYSIDPSSILIKRIEKASESCGIITSLLTSGGGSDANIFNAHGFSAVNLSVGYEDVHTVSESLLLSEFFKTAEIVKAIAIDPS